MLSGWLLAIAALHCARDASGERTSRLPKKVTGGATWVVFAGLEGTGHHMMCSCIAPRRAKASSLCNDESPCFYYDKRMEQPVKALTWAGRGSREEISTLLRSYNRSAERQSLRYMFQCSNTRGDSRGFKWSFPDGELHHHTPTNTNKYTKLNKFYANVPFASTQQQANLEGESTAHGDVAQLAALAEGAGVDLRVVVLVREQWASTALSHHRADFESWMRTLRDNECVLSGQLRSIDPSFFRVFSLESVVRDPGTAAAALAAFLHVEAAVLVDEFIRCVRPSSKPPPTALQKRYAEWVRVPACAITAPAPPNRTTPAPESGPDRTPAPPPSKHTAPKRTPSEPAPKRTAATAESASSKRVYRQFSAQAVARSRGIVLPLEPKKAS